jgi:hypothetical protein
MTPSSGGNRDLATRRSLVGRLGLWLGGGALAVATLLMLLPRSGVAPSDHQHGASSQQAAAAGAREASFGKLASGANARSGDVTLASLQQAVLNHVAEKDEGAPEPSAEDPQRAVLAALDRRMAEAPSDPAEASRLQIQLRAVLDARVLDGAAAEVSCGSSMCRIEISDAEDGHVQKATNAAAASLPKTFAASAVFTAGDSRRAIYAAKNGSDLQYGVKHEPQAAAGAK